MDNVEEVVSKLGIEDIGEYEGDNLFKVELTSSDKFANLYNEISELFETDSDTENSFEDSTSMTVFSNESVEIIASADYENDNYAITIGVK